jgi:hypothetical protein
MFMSSDYKINNSLFSSLNEMIKNPFIVMDNVGNILSRNNEAKLLFNLDQLKNNIYDKLDDPSSELLNGLVEKLFSSQGPIVQLANLKLRDGGDIRGELLLNSYNEENEYFIFLSLKKNEVTPLSAFSEVSILNNDIRDIITNENILNVIEEIRASYPFSLIGRE